MVNKDNDSYFLISTDYGMTWSVLNSTQVNAKLGRIYTSDDGRIVTVSLFIRSITDGKFFS